MAHVTKIKRGGVANLLAHDDRSQEHISNAELNRELTYMNTALVSGDSWKNYKAVMDSDEVHCCKRADVNTLCSWIVTSPLKTDEVPAEVIDRFFDHCHAFMTERYGVELEDGTSNVVSSVTHFDETTPHLHFKFVPLVPDAKKGGYKVSAKEVIDRADLQTFHADLQAYLDEKDIGLIVANETTVDKDYGKSIADLKRETKELERNKRSQLQAVDAEIAVKTAEIEKLDKSTLDAEERLKSANKGIETAENRLHELEGQVERLEQYAQVLDEGLKASLELSRLKKEVEGLCQALNLEAPLKAVHKVEERRIPLEERIKRATSQAKSQKPLKSANTKSQGYSR